MVGEDKACNFCTSSRALSPVVLFTNAMLNGSFPVALPQSAVCYLFLGVGVEVGEAAPALGDFNAVVLKETLRKFCQRPAFWPCGIDGLPQLLLLGVEDGFLRGLAVLGQQGVFFFQLGLTPLLGVVLSVSNSFCCSREKINLV